MFRDYKQNNNSVTMFTSSCDKSLSYRISQTEAISGKIYIHIIKFSIFFFTVKYYTCASIQKSACSVRHSINTHPCPETKSISIPIPPPPHTIKPRIS